MVARKAAFVQWLSVVAAMGIAVFFAAYFGLVSRIWRDDSSHLSSVVAALVIGTAAYIGWLCWRIPDVGSSSGGASEVLEIEEGRSGARSPRIFAPSSGSRDSLSKRSYSKRAATSCRCWARPCSRRCAE
jgi:predicted permease